MPIKNTPINAGFIDLGKWKRDCSQLISEVIPPKSAPVPPGSPPPLPPNTLTTNVSGGLPVAAIFGLLPTGAPGGDAASNLSNSLPGFTGRFSAQLVAEGAAEACDSQTKKQRVGWFYFIKLFVNGQASSGALSAGGTLSLSLGPFGDGNWEPCDCVAGVEPKLALSDVPRYEIEKAALIASGGMSVTASDLHLALTASAPTAGDDMGEVVLASGRRIPVRLHGEAVWAHVGELIHCDKQNGSLK